MFAGFYLVLDLASYEYSRCSIKVCLVYDSVPLINDRLAVLRKA